MPMRLIYSFNANSDSDRKKWKFGLRVPLSFGIRRDGFLFDQGWDLADSLRWAGEGVPLSRLKKYTACLARLFRTGRDGFLLGYGWDPADSLRRAGEGAPLSRLDMVLK